MSTNQKDDDTGQYRQEDPSFMDRYLRGLAEGTPSLPALGRLPEPPRDDDLDTDKWKRRAKALEDKAWLLDQARLHERELSVLYINRVLRHVEAATRLTYRMLRITIATICIAVAILVLSLVVLHHWIEVSKSIF